MRDRWRASPLEHLLELVIDHRGKTPKKLGFPDFTDDGIPVVSAIHIKGGRIVWGERERFAPPELFQKWMPVRLRQGDVLLTSEAPLGEVAQIMTNEPAVLSQRLFALRGKQGVLDNTYLAYYLQSERGQAELHRRATGTTVLGIRQSELRKVIVEYPDFEQQRAIAGVLRALDELIDTNQRLVTALRDHVAATFESMIVPDAEFVPAGEVLDLRYGKALRAQERRLGPVLVVSSAGIVDRHDEPLVSGPGVVVGRKGSVGTVTWVPSDFFPIDTAFYVETTLPMLVAFLALKRMGLQHMNTDSAVPGLNRSNALAQMFPSPADGVVSHFMAVAQPSWDAATELDRENAQQRRTRDELLPLLMSGVVSVGEVAA